MNPPRKKDYIPTLFAPLGHLAGAASHRGYTRRCGALLMLLALGLGAPTARAEPPETRIVRLVAPVANVIDGDTFDADLDGDGRLDVPRERVRLLYVDAPELHDSPKGLDLVHGLPAKAALQALLRESPVELTIFADNERDMYGRTLARVKAGTVDVSLELVRQGHSYFDTRFVFPADYEAFALAEGEAFDAQRGIWGDEASRTRYLERLQREGKTPRSSKNRLYRAGVLPPEALTGKQHLGRYVTAEGALSEKRGLNSGACLLFLRGTSGGRLAVFASASVERRLGLCQWGVGSRVRVEGFYQAYKDRTELVAHYASRN
jgi:endonuclease YncB( thermonuclease family)